MTPDRWRRANEIFHAALELPEAQVDAYLRAECGGDATLFDDVRTMVEAHRRSGFLDEAPLPADAGMARTFTDGQMVAGRYRIVRFINRGGMGEVYEAEDQDLKERVALKTLLPEIAANPAMIARFKQEIHLSRKISHPNVCRVYDLWRHPADGSASGATLFLSMELLAGETLSARLERQGRFRCAEALPLLEQMAAALEAAHQAGIVHRDFKPSNVMLAPASGGPRVVVTDFGLARSFTTSRETTATRTEGGVAGTLDYMAPELLAGQPATASSDVYALGMVAYKMVTGTLPFAADTPLAGAILRAQAPVPSPRGRVTDLDPKWEGAILTALQVDRARRYPRPSEFVAALRGERSTVTVTLPLMTRRRWITAAIVFAAVIAGWLGTRAWTRARSAPSVEAAALFRKGVDDLHAGAYFAATRALGEALRLAPHFGLAHARMAEAWLGLEANEKANREMLVALREDTSRLTAAERLQMDAIGLTLTREFAAAAARYEEIGRMGDGPNLQLDLGRAYEKARQIPKATASYQRACEDAAPDPAACLRLAVLYSQAAEGAKAAEAFRKAESLYQMTSNLEGLVEVAYQRGLAANRVGQLPQAAAELAKALEAARVAGNVQQEIRALLQLGTTAYSNGDTATAENHARQALEIARANQMENLAIRGVTDLGRAHLGKRDYAGAEKYYQDALRLARQSSSASLEADVLLSLAALHDQLKKPDESTAEAQQALGFFQANQYVKESLQCLAIIGRAQRYRGNYAAALESFEKMLRTAESVQDKPQMGLAHESLAGVLFNQELYPKALEHYEQSANLYPDAQHISYAALGAGESLNILGRGTEARARFEQVAATAAKFPALEIYLLQYRGEWLLEQKSYAEAAAVARGALASEAGRNPVANSELKRVLGLALLGAGNRGQGRRTCEESLAAIVKLNDAAACLRSRLAVLQARVETGDRAGALAVFQELQPALGGHPESQWRALALISRVDGRHATAAEAALRGLEAAWGQAHYQQYLTRPDLKELARPLLH